jgi:raffinose/stachyose/melibiose transport system substrate-binding protein
MPMRKPPVVRIMALALALFVLSGLVAWMVVRMAEDDEKRRELKPSDILQVWHLGMPERVSSRIRSMADDFQEAHGGFRVVVRQYGRTAYAQELFIRAMWSEPVDLFHISPGRPLEGVVREVGLKPVTEGPVAGVLERIREPFLDLGRVDGEMYAVPLEARIAVFWYDREVFERLGLETPETWAELLGVIAGLREAGLVPIALGNEGRWPVLMYYGYLLDRLQVRHVMDRAVRSAETKGIRDPRFARAWAMVRELVDAGAFSEDAAQGSPHDALTEFCYGRAGLYLGSTEVAEDCYSENRAMFHRLDCFAFPRVEGVEGSGRSAFLGTTRLNMASWPESARAAEAAELLDQLLGPELAEALAAEGHIPALKDGWDTSVMPAPVRRAMQLLEATGKEVQPYLDLALMASYADSPLVMKQGLPSLSGTLLDQSEGVFNGTITPEQAADTMATLVEQYADMRRRNAEPQ